MCMLRSTSSFICFLLMNDEDTLTFDDWVSSLSFGSLRYIGRELTNNIPQYHLQMSNESISDAVAFSSVVSVLISILGLNA